jgi:fatty-acyl-CoA synthase/long-chain acyl-CoA synthetase
MYPMPDLLTLHAQAQPDKPALVDDRPDGTVTRLTMSELEAAANRMGHALADLGLRAGMKVVWCGANSVPVVTFVNAARKLGLTAVPLNYRLSPEEAAYVTDHSDATVVFVDAEQAPMFATIRRDLPKVEHVVVFDGAVPPGMLDLADLLAGASDETLPERDAAASGATMTYTSGTTGKPKGAYRRGPADPALGAGLMQLIGYVPDDVYLPTGPLYHSGPAAFMAIAQAFGNTVVLQRKFDPEDWLRLIDTYGITTTFSAPTPIRMVCSLPDEVKARYDRSSMKRLIANAAPWSYALKQRYLTDFPADSLWEVYGSTELGVNCVLEPQDQLRKPGSCGKPAPLVEVGLFDEQGNPVEGTGPDHPGELFVRSAGVFADYYKQHDRYEEDRRSDGFHTVGDIAYRDDEGYLYICDRKKDMIISGGMNIYPAEVEAALDEHPDVADVAVFGIPSDDWGESVHAVIVTAEGSSLAEADVVAFAREKVAGYKVPRSVSFAAALPRTGSGKLLKRELRAPFWAGHDVKVG